MTFQRLQAVPLFNGLKIKYCRIVHKNIYCLEVAEDPVHKRLDTFLVGKVQITKVLSPVRIILGLFLISGRLLNLIGDDNKGPFGREAGCGG